MKMKPLGRTGLNVSQICLGSMTWGSQNTQSEGHQQMDYAVSQGVNFIDTAEMYPTTPFAFETHGDTEAIIGTWLKKRGKRDDIIVATKVNGQSEQPSPLGDRITAKKIRESCEKSLKRLQTDYIDLYQLHWPNRGSYHFRQNWGFSPESQDKVQAKAEIEDALEGLEQLVREGKIHHVGLSNESVWGASQFVSLSQTRDLPRIATVQNEYSLLHRIFDLDWAEFSHHEDVGLLAFSSLACGLLTGKYRHGDIPAGSRMSMNATLGGRVHDRSGPAIDAYLDLAAKHNIDPAQFALAFCLTRPFMTSVIIGATNMEQLKICIDAANVTLADVILSEIETIHKQWSMPL